MSNDLEILDASLRASLKLWEEQKQGKTLLGQDPPDGDVLAPLIAAIEQCEAYKSVAGKVLFSANSGLVLQASILALPLLFRAEYAAPDTSQALGWMIRLLETQQTDGVFKAAIWGLSLDQEAVLSDGSRLMPFDQFPDCVIKRRIHQRARKLWDGSAWLTENYYDLPCTTYIKKVPNFPYIGKNDAPFLVMSDLEKSAYDLLVFLQGRTASQPLALGYWFEYEDQDLDFSKHENYISWVLPEVIPRIPAYIPAVAQSVLQEHRSFLALPREWRNDLTRSMERFTLSQCRRQLVDRILDLTLAFEISVSGKGDNAPPSWKVSVRTAQLIGGDINERQERRRVIAALYSLRNRGTHGGSLKGAEKTKPEEVLAGATKIYGELLTSFLGMSEPPDWGSIELQSP